MISSFDLLMRVPVAGGSPLVKATMSDEDGISIAENANELAPAIEVNENTRKAASRVLICFANVPGQVSPLAFGMISCASRRHDKSAEGMGISCTGLFDFFYDLSS